MGLALVFKVMAHEKGLEEFEISERREEVRHLINICLAGLEHMYK